MNLIKLRPPELDAEASRLTEAPAVEVQTPKELYARQEWLHELPSDKTLAVSEMNMQPADVSTVPRRKN